MAVATIMECGDSDGEQEMFTHVAEVGFCHRPFFFGLFPGRDTNH